MKVFWFIIFFSTCFCVKCRFVHFVVRKSFSTNFAILHCIYLFVQRYKLFLFVFYTIAKITEFKIRDVERYNHIQCCQCRWYWNHQIFVNEILFFWLFEYSNVHQRVINDYDVYVFFFINDFFDLFANFLKFDDISKSLICIFQIINLNLICRDSNECFETFCKRQK